MNPAFPRYFRVHVSEGMLRRSSTATNVHWPESSETEIFVFWPEWRNRNSQRSALGWPRLSTLRQLRIPSAIPHCHHLRKHSSFLGRDPLDPHFSGGCSPDPVSNCCGCVYVRKSGWSRSQFVVESAGPAYHLISETSMGNTFKTAFLLTLLTLLLMSIGRFFGGQNGMLLALVFAAVMNFVSYFYSDKIALAMYRAQPVTREELPRAYAAVERLTQKIGIPMPKIYVIPNESPNAFATGRNPQHASVAVTQGILNLLNDEELEGVLAHELGHVNNRDILISSVAATVAGAITMLASMGRLAMIFGGWVAIAKNAAAEESARCSC